jgi:hypothetical protein
MWQNKYIGIPFLDKGRDTDGIDCWGLVRLVYKQEYNIDLPNFSTEYEADDTERMRDLFAQYKEGWEQIDAPTEGCIVLFNILGVESHMGIAISSTHFLHARDKYTSAIESFESVGWRNRITGFYKYSENKSAILNVVPHPLRTERFTIPILPGTTLDKLANWIKFEYKIAEELASKITILVNGIVVEQSKWHTTALKDTDRVEYRAVPGKGNTLRLVLTLALVAASGGLTVAAGNALGIAGATGAGATAATFASANLMAYTAISTGIMMVGGALINAIAPIRPPDINTPGTSIQQYMVNGGANQVRPYEAIPVILGKVKITPPLGAVNYLTYENDTESYLSMLLLWGYGPLNIDASTLKIGNISISEYTLPVPPVTLDRKTTPTAQQSLDFTAIYGKDVDVVASNATLTCPGQYSAVLTEGTFGPWVPASSGAAVYNANGTIVPISQFTVSFHMPQGLRRIFAEGKESGKEESVWVRIEIQVKDGSGPWTTWTDFALGDGTVKKDAFTINKTYYNLNSTNEVQVRVRRKTGADLEWTKEANGYAKAQIYAQVVLLQTVFLRNTAPIKEPINCAFAGTALKIKANEQLNGQIEGINAIVQTWAPSWNGSAWTTMATNNPAALFLYVLKHPANPQRVKEADVASKINLSQIQYWHSYCVTKGFEFNSVIGSQRSILEVLRDICAAGRASPAMIDGKWSVVIDEPKSNIVQHFTPHNSWGFESTKALAKMPDGLRVTYIDEDQDYQQAEVIVYNAGKSLSNAELFESIQLPGVTKKSSVIDHARWHFAQAKLRPEVYRLNSDIEYLVCNRGDRVKVMHDVPMWGTGSGRVKQRVSSTEFVLDEQVFIDITKNYTIRFRSALGGTVERTLDKTGMATGYHTTIKLSTSATSTEVDASDLYMFGEYHQEAQDLIVLSIEPSSNKSATLTLVDYGVTDTYNIFTDYATLTESVIFESQITLPGQDLRNSFVDTDVPTVSLIISDESAAKLLSTGNYEQRIKISYTNPQELPRSTQKIECSYYLQTSSTTSSGITTSSTLINANTFTEDYSAGSIYISGVVKDQVYKIKLRYVASDGRTGPWTSELTHTVGQFTNYATVASVDVDLDTYHLVMKAVSTTPINPALFKHYEYRIYRDTGTGDFWNTVPDSTNQIKVVKSTGTAQQSLLDFTGSRISEAGVKYRIACRTVDIHDSYGDTSALSSILIKTII